MMAVVRVGITLEQLWHRVPGGTAVAALETLRALGDMSEAAALELVGIAGRHRHEPSEPWRPPSGIPMHHHRWLSGPALYEAWLRSPIASPDAIAGPFDVVHATTIIPCPTTAPLVVTLHDLAFLHEPDHFTRRGVSVFRRSLDRIRDRASVVLCSSTATMHDAVAAGLDPGRLRCVPLGVRTHHVTASDRIRVRERFGLPEQYLLFVGTLEPRKNLDGLLDALVRLPDAPALVIAGAAGWGGAQQRVRDRLEGDLAGRVHLIGFVPEGDLPALYAEASVFCMPSRREGYGLPVLEAMTQGTPVVTSRGTATEETAGGAAVLVDPNDPVDIARGLSAALADGDQWSARARRRGAEMSWDATASATVQAYREAVMEAPR